MGDTATDGALWKVDSCSNILTCGVNTTEPGRAASLKGLLRWLPGRLTGRGRGLQGRLGGRCLGHALAGDCWWLQIWRVRPDKDVRFIEVTRRAIIFSFDEAVESSTCPIWIKSRPTTHCCVLCTHPLRTRHPFFSHRAERARERLRELFKPSLRTPLPKTLFPCMRFK